MKNLIFLLLILTPLVSFSANPKWISIQDYTESGKLDLKISGIGGHTENCLELKLKNLTEDTLFIKLEAGRRFVSEDTTEQDILIVKEKKILLTPFAKLDVPGWGFCCESSMHSPGVGSKFKVGFMAPTSWVKLAKFLDSLNFPSSIAQSAVWVLSNGHPISSVYEKNNPQFKKLRDFLSQCTGIQNTWYSITYEFDPNQLFSGRHEKILGEIEYYLPNNAIVTLNVRSRESGIIHKVLIESTPTGPGNYVYNLDLLVKGWPKGNYDIYLYEDFSNLKVKKSFQL